jgi:CRISPR-associated protein Cas2
MQWIRKSPNAKDKQFGEIELFYGKKASGVKTPGQQLELF